MYVLASTSGPCIFFLPQGGLDNYLVNTKPDKLDSELGMWLKEQVILTALAFCCARPGCPLLAVQSRAHATSVLSFCEAGFSVGLA